MPQHGTDRAGADLPDFDEFWDYDDPAGTESKFREVLPAAKESGDASYLAQLLTQIARTEGLQGRFDDAHKTLDEADALIGDGMTVARVRSLLERGRVFNSAKQLDQARPLFLAAWEQASKSAEDFHAIDAAHMLGIVDHGDDSLTWNERAIALAEISRDEKASGWLGSLYNNTGWTYHDMGRYADALRCHEKNLRWQKQHDKTGMVRVARWCIARPLRSLGRVEEALAAQRALQKQHESLGTSDGYVQEELGECLLLLDRESEARAHFANAYDLLGKDVRLAANEKDRLDRLQQLGSGDE